MGKLEYPFYINHDTIVEVQKIAEDGVCCKNFLEDLKVLEEDAKLRPHRDMHWELSRLISLYYAPELVMKDRTFAKLHSYLLSLWRTELEKQGQQLPTNSPNNNSPR